MSSGLPFHTNFVSGSFKSLSGKMSTRGMTIEMSGSQAIATPLVIPENTDRIWLVIQSRADSDDETYFSFVGTNDTGSIRLARGEKAQIDDHLPYTGAITLAPVSGTSNIMVVEASVL